MKTFFQDEFINKVVLSRLKREIKTKQLYETINEINNLNELQNKIISSNNINVSYQKAKNPEE